MARNFIGLTATIWLFGGIIMLKTAVLKIYGEEHVIVSNQKVLFFTKTNKIKRKKEISKKDISKVCLVSDLNSENDCHLALFPKKGRRKKIITSRSRKAIHYIEKKINEKIGFIP